MKSIIKFRVKEILDGVENSDWSYFTLGDLACSNFSTNHREFIGETWGEYTGIKDSNGKDVYSGDFIKFRTTTESKIFFVEYLEDYAQWWGVSYGGFSMTLYDLKRDGEVVGNIIDNPELIKK